MKYTEDTSTKYNNIGIKGTTYSIAFYKLLSLILLLEKPSGEMLDFGTGTGRLIRLLKEYFTNIVFLGADKSKNMLANLPNFAKTIYLESNKLPLGNETISFITITSVLEEIKTKEDLSNIFAEFRRVLKKESRLYIILANPEAIKNNCHFYSYSFVSDRNIKDSETYQCISSLPKFSFKDTFWSKETIMDLLIANSFKVRKVITPKGKKNANFALRDEKKIAPDIIIVAQKLQHDVI